MAEIKSRIVIANVFQEAPFHHPLVRREAPVRGHIIKRGKKYSFVVDLPAGPDGKRRQKWVSGFETKAKAEGELAKFLAKHGQGWPDLTAPSTLSYERYVFDRWLPFKKEQVKLTTYEGYRIRMTAHIIKHIGSWPIRNITALALNDMYAELLRNGRLFDRELHGPGLSKYSVKHIHDAVHASLEDAVRWRLLPENPAKRADPPKNYYIRQNNLTWTAEEARAFLRFIEGEYDEALWYVLIFNGLRRGEVLGLQWGDFLENPDGLWVRRALVQDAGTRLLHLDTPKTVRSVRALGLHPAVAAQLREHRLRQHERHIAIGPEDLIFTRPDGRPVRPGGLTERFADLRYYSDLKSIRLHDLRHSYATIALHVGENIKDLSASLGHSGTSFTMDTYAQSQPANQIVLSHRVGDHILGE